MTGLTVKEVNGVYRWLLVASGAYQDRDGEWVTKAALEKWVDGFMSTTTKGIGTVPRRPNGETVVYRWWHMGIPNPVTKSRGPGLDLGEADFADLHKNSLIISGTFYNPAIGAAFKSRQGELGNSIGFFHPKDEPRDGAFYNIDVFEVSGLPLSRASYPFTGSKII